MQQIILLALFVAALYYLYRKLIKNRGCNCSSKSCCTPPTLPKKKPVSKE
ncbi:MAG: hypothetical protein JXQ81_14335 [Desulfuromonadales bacterium]|nr:hypothetical protein [Desulfuromonadales bacterium]